MLTYIHTHLSTHGFNLPFKYFMIHKFVFIFCNFAVRLVDGPSIYEGRVEVQYNGIWGTVCDYGWDLNDAQVVCSQLGFGRATAAEHNAFYGEGYGQNWLYNVNCNGVEWTVGNCSHSGWGSYCNHHDDASVKCSSGRYMRSVIYLKLYFMAKRL